MPQHSIVSLFSRIDAVELPYCMFLNRTGRFRIINRFFAIISRLGNGVFWYATIALMPVVYGHSALYPALQITVTGLAGLLVYKLLKERLVRERPYLSNQIIECGVLPLDRYSFPSGHTLHAVSFSTMMIAFDPLFSWIVLPFTLLVALSRVILGLHYPTDVLAGGAIGFMIALTSLNLVVLG